MIAYFPKPYPDELLYSVFSRYYVKSGYMAYTYAAQDLYENKLTRPDMEFINMLSTEVKDILRKYMPLKELVLKHTMFPYYGRFLNKERRNKAIESLVNMDKQYTNLLFIPKNKNKRFMRYCPLCAKEDREEHGETYWHRIHQMPGVDICPVHFCKLLDSNLEISSKVSPCLISAENIIPKNNNMSISENQLECNVAKYMLDVFIADVDMESDVSVGDFLHSRMQNTKYLSPRGEQRNIAVLHSDFSEYYKHMPNNSLKEKWQIQKIFANNRFSTFEISLLANFLKIPINELTKMKIPNKTQQQMFDEEVMKLHKKGLNYRQIATKMNASYDVVKPIGEGKYGCYHHPKENLKKVGAKKKDWDNVDNTMLPHVKKLIKKSNDPPVKITPGTVERLLELPKKTICNCPECMKEIQKYYESSEEYRARRIMWAVHKVIDEHMVLNWTQVYKLTNIRKIDLSTLYCYMDNDILEIIKKII